MAPLVWSLLQYILLPFLYRPIISCFFGTLTKTQIHERLHSLSIVHGTTQTQKDDLDCNGGLLFPVQALIFT